MVRAKKGPARQHWFRGCVLDTSVSECWGRWRWQWGRWGRWVCTWLAHSPVYLNLLEDVEVKSSGKRSNDERERERDLVAGDGQGLQGWIPDLLPSLGCTDSGKCCCDVGMRGRRMQMAMAIGRGIWQCLYAFLQKKGDEATPHKEEASAHLISRQDKGDSVCGLNRHRRLIDNGGGSHTLLSLTPTVTPYPSSISHA